MVSIRLARSGAKKRPFYHIVATDRRNKRDGVKLERLGFYNPMAAENEVKLQLNHERVEYWLSKGARASERVISLMGQQQAAS